MNRLLVAISSLMIIGCSSETATTPTVEQKWVNPDILAEPGFDPVPLIEKSAESWSGKAIMDSMTFGLSRRTVIYRNGSIVVERAEGGELLRVSMQAGVADRCGKTEDLYRAYSALSVPLGFEPVPQDVRARLDEAFEAGGFTEPLKVGRITIKASGGCLDTLTVRPSE